MIMTEGSMILSLKENYISELFSALKEKFIEELRVGDIGEGIKEAISSHEAFAIDLGNFHFSVTHTVVSTWLAMVLIAFLAIWLGKRFEEIPRGRQIVTEGFVDLMMNLCKGQHMNDEQASKVAPFIGSMAAFICISNCFSMFKISPPAKDPVFPITLALFTIIYVIFTGIRLVGLKGFWKSLTYPKAALLPFRILDYVIKPISLSLRLFGNIFGAFILMEFIYIIIPFIIPGILGIWFDLADGLLQGAVFAYLSVVYIGEIIEGAHGDSDDKSKKRVNSKRKKTAKVLQS
jgi:F-type H+-transporting ATPase subunit a